MTIIGNLPNTLLNGTIADASQVMADFNFIINQVNANAVAAGTAQPGQLINVQIFTASATYTPSGGMRICICEVQGAGGAGGGAGGAVGGNVSIGAPGASGAYAKQILTAVQVGASQTVNVGVGGLGASSSTGGTGSASSVGALITANGGTGGGIANNIGAPGLNGNGALITSTGSGQIISFSFGSAPLPSFAISNTVAVPAPGGGSVFGPGGGSPGVNTIGVNASNYGTGGSGVVLNNAGGTTSGGNGKAGIVIIYEYA